LSGLIVVNLDFGDSSDEAIAKLNDSGATAIVLNIFKVESFVQTVMPQTAVKKLVYVGIGIHDFSFWSKAEQVRYRDSKIGFVERNNLELHMSDRLVKFSRAVAKGRKMPFEEVSTGPDEVVAIQYGSEVEGRVQGAMLTNRNLIAAGLVSRQ
jgi:long-chain acyl-CoA synthetase